MHCIDTVQYSCPFSLQFDTQTAETYNTYIADSETTQQEHQQESGEMQHSMCSDTLCAGVTYSMRAGIGAAVC